MYAPINLSEYVYSPEKFTVPSPGSSSVIESTPTVPPKGWLGNLTDFIKSGAEIYSTITKAQAEAATVKQPQYSSVVPTMITTSPVNAASVNSGLTPVLPFNTLYIDSPTGAQGAQEVGAASGAAVNIPLVITVLVIIFLVLFFVKRGR
jgi:hypothetical protein